MSDDKKSTDKPVTNEKGENFGQCVSDAAGVKNTCLSTSKDALKICTNAENADKIAKIIEGKIRAYASMLPVLHFNLMRAWVAAVKNTDLAAVYTPSDQVLNANQNKLQYRTPQRRIEGLYSEGGE